MFKEFGIRHLVTAAYPPPPPPQTNGQDERTNGTFKRQLSEVECRLFKVA